MSSFYGINKKDAAPVTCEDVLSIPKFYNEKYMEAKSSNTKDIKNVINVVLSTIGLSLDSVPCGILPKYDIHNMGAVQVIKLGLLEGIKNNKFYDLCLDEGGNPLILTVGEESFVPETVYYSIIHEAEKVDYCVIIKGFDPMPERIVKETIPLIVNGEGNGVEIIGLGLFQYTSCDNKIFDYNGCISYADPNLQDTTKDEMDSAFELEPFESLIGYAFTCKKPEDVDVVFSDTTQRVLNFHVCEEHTVTMLPQSYKRPEMGSVRLDVDVSEEYCEQIEDVCNSCRLLDPDQLIKFYESDITILNVDQILFTAERVNNYISNNENKYNDICDADSSGPGDTVYSSYNMCDIFDTSIVTRQLNIGQDFYYEIKSELVGTNSAGSEMINHVLSAGIPVRKLTCESSNNSSYYMRNVRMFAGSSSHVFIPFNGIALITVDKPAIYVTKKTDTAIGNITKSGAAVVLDHTEEIEKIAKEITLCATPIVTLDRPSNTAYYVDGVTTLIEMEDCIQDNDPTTEEDLQNTPCEIMNSSTSGKATVDITLPFLENDGELVEVANLLGDYFSAEYKQSVSTIPGHAVSSSDIGKTFNDGIVNKIVWSYQDKSLYKATVTSGPFLSGVDSFNTSMWVRHTDQSLSREGIVTGDYGNGLEFKVYVRNIGTYVALNMTMNIIEVGDVVNVTIYNNPAETYYE